MGWFVYLFAIPSYRFTSFRVVFVKKLSLISLPVLFFSIPNHYLKNFYSLSWKENLSPQRDQQKEPAVPSSWALFTIFSTIAKNATRQWLRGTFSQPGEPASQSADGLRLGARRWTRVTVPATAPGTCAEPVSTNQQESAQHELRKQKNNVCTGYSLSKLNYVFMAMIIMLFMFCQGVVGTWTDARKTLTRKYICMYYIHIFLNT